MLETDQRTALQLLYRKTEVSLYEGISLNHKMIQTNSRNIKLPLFLTRVTCD